MKRRWKKRYTLLLILVLVIGMFVCARKVLIQNIFDEMYFGTKDIFGGYLTDTSWMNMEGLAKNGDVVKYAVPGEIRIGLSRSILNDDEGFQILWETKEKRLVFIYSVDDLENEHAESAVLDIYYSPYQKKIEVRPLRIVSCQNIYGDTSAKAIDEFFMKYGSSEAVFYERFEAVFEEAIIENWRTGNQDTLFHDALGRFEIVDGEGKEQS